jgi:hypothetical protein
LDCVLHLKSQKEAFLKNDKVPVWIYRGRSFYSEDAHAQLFKESEKQTESEKTKTCKKCRLIGVGKWTELGRLTTPFPFLISASQPELRSS